MEDKYKIKLRAKEPVNGYQTGEYVTIINRIFDRMNGVAFHPIDSKFEVVYSRLFTGRTDKNGVDIYDGDICRCRHYQQHTGKYLYLIQKVVFEHSSFSVIVYSKNNAPATGTYDNCPLSLVKDIEVIGNIDDNPELFVM